MRVFCQKIYIHAMPECNIPWYPVADRDGGYATSDREKIKSLQDM